MRSRFNSGTGRDCRNRTQPKVASLDYLLYTSAIPKYSTRWYFTSRNLPEQRHVIVMFSSSHSRDPSRTERRTTTDNGPSQPRDSQGRSSRNEKPDPRRQQSPQPEASHRRQQSGSQRTNREVEERQKEKVRITTRETVTRKRSPERRSAPSQPAERQRPPDLARAYSGDPRPSNRAEAPQSRYSCNNWAFLIG